MKKLYLLSIVSACAYLFPQQLAANDTCTASFTYSPTGMTAFFYSSALLSPGTVHNWIFGDGSAGDASPNPTHTYLAPGAYVVKHYILNSATNCKDSAIKEVRIPLNDCTIYPKFSYQKDGEDCRKIKFINESIPLSQNVHFTWRFGDGTTSNEINPTHVYSNDGNYNVCMTMDSGHNCIKDICRTIEVQCNQQCHLEVKFEWKVAEDNQRKIIFQNQTIVPSSNTNYEWKFGDGILSHEKDPVHLYEHAGEYEVCLTVRTGDDCKKTICRKVMVAACDVRARYEWKQDSSRWNKVWLANHSQPIQNIWRTSWSYGDGNASQDFNSFHEYAQQGKYVVCLKVQSLNGCIDTYCDTVVLRKPDSCQNHAEFRFEARANNPLEFQFKPAQVNLTWKYYWDFGDGRTSTAVTPVHKFDHPGNYKVCLTVVTLNNCKTNVCKEIRVGVSVKCDTVQLKFQYKRDVMDPGRVSFSAVSNVPINKQKWAIIRLRLSSAPPPVPVIIDGINPTYNFKDTGWYLVCLYASTAGDCSKIFCDRIFIEKVDNVPALTGSDVRVLPNPVVHTAILEFQMEKPGLVNIRLLDVSGSPQVTFSGIGQVGNNRISVPVDRLANGFYMVEIRYANRLKLGKFQKS